MHHSDYKCLNWHEPQWRELWSPPAGLPHALLLTGQAGIGKRAFAEALAARLICESPDAADAPACGGCLSCRWLAAGSHPDFRLVVPEAEAETESESTAEDKKKASRQIRIEQIRALEAFVFVGGHRNRARVVLIDPADAMNPAAANALLKILEEPPASVYFILVSSQWRRLLPTIRSRCRVLALKRPGYDEARSWLAARDDARAIDILPLLGPAPLLAIEESQRGRASALLGFIGTLTDPGRDPLALAARWETHLQVKNETGLPMEALVVTLQKWIADLAQGKLAGRTRFHPAKDVMRVGGKASVAALFRCYNDLVKMRSLAAHPLNPRLFLEEMATRYLRALAPESGGERS